MVYGFASAAIVCAAAMSGFVGSDLINQMYASSPMPDMPRILLAYTFRVNQAFSSIYTVGSCAAILMWSVAALQTRRLARGHAVYGIVLAVAIVGALFSGYLKPDAHGFGLVVLTQGIWFVIAGSSLMRSDDAVGIDAELTLARDA